MVFQHYALYPHMTVRENMSFGLRNVRLPPAEIDKRVDDGGEDAGDRRICWIASRRRFRAASGSASRSAAPSSKSRSCSCSTSRLSNLDAALRVRTRLEIAQLHQRVDAAMIFVTHDQVEAMTLAASHRGDEQPQDRANRHADGNLFAAGDHVRRELRRHAGDEFPRRSRLIDGQKRLRLARELAGRGDRRRPRIDKASLPKSGVVQARHSRRVAAISVRSGKGETERAAQFVERLGRSHAGVRRAGRRHDDRRRGCRQQPRRDQRSGRREVRRQRRTPFRRSGPRPSRRAGWANVSAATSDIASTRARRAELELSIAGGRSELRRAQLDAAPAAQQSRWSHCSMWRRSCSCMSLLLVYPLFAGILVLSLHKADLFGGERFVGLREFRPPGQRRSVPRHGRQHFLFHPADGAGAGRHRPRPGAGAEPPDAHCALCCGRVLLLVGAVGDHRHAAVAGGVHARRAAFSPNLLRSCSATSRSPS